MDLCLNTKHNCMRNSGVSLHNITLTIILTVKSYLIMRVNQPLYFQWRDIWLIHNDNEGESTPLFPVELEKLFIYIQY